MAKLTFTIGEVAELLDITPKTLRHYHKIGLLEEPQRDVNNYRLYAIGQLEKLQIILRLKSLGLSLQQIKLILDADDPDRLVHTVLQQHQQRIKNEIRQLQDYLENTQHYLTSDTNLLATLEKGKAEHSSMTILSDTVKSHSNGLSDILVELEGDVLSQIDCYQWTAGYDVFWHQVGTHIVKHMLTQESNIILWMERYLTLEAMDEDDLQAKAWLQEFTHSPIAPLFSQSLHPPPTASFPDKEQQIIVKLLPSLLYEKGSPLQQAFLKVLIGK